MADKKGRGRPALVAIGACGLLLSLAQSTMAEEPGEYLEAALEAGRFIDSTAQKTVTSAVWPIVAERPDQIAFDLYYGTSGIVLFWLELYRTTGDPQWLDQARLGANALLNHLSEPSGDPGLYTGLAGIGFVLDEVHRATGERRYQEGARKVVLSLERSARRVGAGVEWNDTTDIIAGSAGIGLFLLYAERELGLASARQLAIDAGDRLIERAERMGVGLDWAMTPDFDRRLPNFSHGTAGVAYFLASLFAQTGEQRFLDAALEGARFLDSIMEKDVEGQSCLLYHHRPGGEDLFYLGWCHGPAGTARLFFRLWQLTGDNRWRQGVDQLAQGVLSSGIPERRTAGFWNNVSQCCGSAGVGELFLSLYQVFGEPQHLDFAKRVTADLLRRASRDDPGWRWPQAENRVEPDVLEAQTGLMQGAAGIGLWLLRLDAVDRGRRFELVLPDSPFALESASPETRSAPTRAPLPSKKTPPSAKMER